MKNKNLPSYNKKSRVLPQQSSLHTGSEQFPVEQAFVYPCVDNTLIQKLAFVCDEQGNTG